MDIKHRVLGFIRKHRLIASGDMLLVGVSGGADSVMLAHVLHSLRPELSLRLHMVHFNHRLRPTSERDQKCVEALAAKLNIPLTVGRRKGGPRQRASEEEARQWRFEFFAQEAVRLKADAVALAHTQNDVAETVLMRVVRGSGLYGLRAILPQRSIDGMKVIRPLAEISRQDIEAYVRRHGLRYCTDETNVRTDYLRNKVRLKLLPQLAKAYNPGIYGALADLAEIAVEDYDFLQQALLHRIKENVVSFKGTVRIKLTFLKRQHPAMARLLLRHAFERLKGDLRQVTFAHIEQTRDMVAHQPEGAMVHWPRRVRAIKKKGYVEFSV